MAHNKKYNVKTIEALLESDDELPDSCNETPETPSYINDERFDKIRFDWIYDKKMRCNKSNVPKNNDIVTVNSNINNVEAPRNSNDELTRKRVLKRNDIYCLQSVENHLSGNLLIWFADFLMLKDMQSKYNLCKGCLVYENAASVFNLHEHKAIDKRGDIENNQNTKCKILIKNK